PVAGFRGEPVDTNPSFRAACAFGLPAVWQAPDVPGVFSRETHRLGSVVVGAEYLGAGQLSVDGARAYARGVRSCLREWGLLPGSPPTASRIEGFYSSRWLLCPATGVFCAQRQPGEFYAPGDTLALIRSASGRRLAELCADSPGRVLAVR